MEPLRAHPSLTCVRLFSAFAKQFGVEHAQLMATLPALTDLQVSANWSIEMMHALSDTRSQPTEDARAVASSSVSHASSSPSVNESSVLPRRNTVLRLLPGDYVVDSAAWMDALSAFPNLLAFTPRSFSCADELACTSLAALSQLHTVELDCAAQVDLHSLCGAIRRLVHLTDLLLVHAQLTDDLLCYALEPLPSVRYLRLAVDRFRTPELIMPTLGFTALPCLSRSLHSLTLPCARLPAWSECLPQLLRLHALQWLVIDATTFEGEMPEDHQRRAFIYTVSQGCRISSSEQEYERRSQEQEKAQEGVNNGATSGCKHALA